MSLKRYISAVLLLLAIVGALQQEPAAIPNQEIAFQYINADTSKDATQTALTLLKKALLELDVTSVKIKEGASGKFKISYHSTTDAHFIKRELAKHISAAFGGIKDVANAGELPFKEQPSQYDLEVYDLLNTLDLDSGLEGTVTLEPKLKGDHFLNVKTSAGLTTRIYKHSNSITSVQLKTQSANNALLKDVVFLHIPEVRAGPVACQLLY